MGTAYRRFADKDELIDALLESRIDEMVAMAERGLEDPDPWDGLVGYIVGALELQVRDRGLKEVLFAPGRGKKRVAAAKGRMGPAVTALADRARAAGVVREDFQPSDIPLIYLMLGTVVDFSRGFEDGLYRRYLAILLEGIRAGGQPPELPVPALELGDVPGGHGQVQEPLGVLARAQPRDDLVQPPPRLGAARPRPRTARPPARPTAPARRTPARAAARGCATYCSRSLDSSTAARQAPSPPR